MRSGNIYLPGESGATLRTAGLNADYWSSRESSTHYDGTAVLSGYHLNFGATGVYPSAGPRERWRGYSLRCLSTVLDI